MSTEEDPPPTLEELRAEEDERVAELTKNVSNRRGDYQAHLPMGRFRFRWWHQKEARTNWRWYFYTVRRAYSCGYYLSRDPAHRHNRHAKSLNYNEKRPSAVGTRSLRVFLSGKSLPRHLRLGSFYYPLNPSYSRALEEQINNAIRRARTNGRQRSKKQQVFAYHDDEAAQNWRFYMEDE